MRYTPFSYQERYGLRLQRLALDGGFTCPNRDGKVGTGGCTFCDNRAFHPAYTQGKSITQQIEAGIAFHAKRGRKADGYLAYFQAFSNTYAPLEVLRGRYEEALSHPAVKGIVSSVPPSFTDAPWGLLKQEELLKSLEKRLEERNACQGYKSILSLHD